MARKPSKPVGDVSSDELDTQIKAFLKKGGKINQIPTGQSSFDAKHASKQFKISPSKS